MSSGTKQTERTPCPDVVIGENSSVNLSSTVARLADRRRDGRASMNEILDADGVDEVRSPVK
jgi:hypothetical protein